MKRMLLALAIVSLTALPALAAESAADGKPDKASRLVNADKKTKLALQGYDPVAFHTDGKAIKGVEAIEATHAGFVYLFATAEHKAAFQADPEKYLPAYGGYCAWGVAKGDLYPVKIDTWEIVDGRLILQYDQGAKKKFKAKQKENFEKAEKNWPKLVEKNVKDEAAK